MAILWKDNGDGTASRFYYRYLNETELYNLVQDAIRYHWKDLNLSHTRITSLPDSIGNLTSLQTLNLHSTQITTLPDSIGNLSNLRLLNLSDTPLESLPDSIGNLHGLKSLNLSGTKIKNLPSSIVNLVNLEAMDLTYTKITRLPSSFGNLVNLQYLNLFRTEISILPDSISRLSNLKYLDLSGTQITKIPDSVGNLPNLSTLHLCYLFLDTIPYSIVQMGLPFVEENIREAHECVNLMGVTLREGDISLFRQPRSIIEEYYRNRVIQLVSECKVIFLGDGGAGKSSLIERIVHPERPFLEDSLPTDGIKMTKWQTTLDGNPLTIRFLDFGGQEIMHSMHRCFLTSHTVYVLVCESRDDAEIDSVTVRWMETIKSFATGCPVILALNKSDLNPNVTVNERALKKINKYYRLMLHTSAKMDDDPGVKQLVSSILREVPMCLKKMGGNIGILGLKKKLEDMADDYISPEQFHNLCNQYKIPENLRMGVLDWFQDLGISYTFSSLLRDVYVLNPEWLTNGIYRLILRTPNGGFLPHNTILQALQTPNSRDINPNKIYSAQEMEFILFIMRKFEISMALQREFTDADVIEMIPMKMDKSPPSNRIDLDAFYTAESLHLRWEATFLPNNLIHRLMIHKHTELDKSCAWRTGGCFYQRDEGNCSALVEMDDRAMAMDVFVRGKYDARVYMHTFRSEINRILDSLNIVAEEIIFCTIDGQEGRIAYKDVLQQYWDGIEKMLIPGTRSYVNPAQLLHENYIKFEGQTEMNVTNNYNAPVGQANIVEGRHNIFK